MNIEYEFLKSDTVNDFLYFTFPKYRLVFLTEDVETLCAIGVRVGKKPAGLIMSKLIPAEKKAVVLSVSVKSIHRRKGIATNLFGKLEDFLLGNGYRTITIDYIKDSKSIDYLEKILARCGWEEPEVKTMLCKIHYKKLLKSGWLTKYGLPEEYSIFLWKDISDEEKKIIFSYENKDGWYPHNLNPFTLGANNQSPNSLGLKYNGQIIGWIIVQKLSKNALNYARLFVCRDFQDMGKVIVMLAEAIKLQAKAKIAYGFFSFDMDNKRMKLFYEKRFKPYVSKTNARLSSFRLL